MNMQISQGGFRFRITPAELEELLRGEELAQSVRAGAGCFDYCIAPVEEGDMLMLAREGAGFRLCVPRAALVELRDKGRSREGIRTQYGAAGITLQVDIKTRFGKAG